MELAETLEVTAQDMESRGNLSQASTLMASAQRIVALHQLLGKCLPHVQAAVQSEHTLSCTGPRHELPIDRLLGEVKAALK